MAYWVIWIRKERFWKLIFSGCLERKDLLDIFFFNFQLAKTKFEFWCVIFDFAVVLYSSLTRGEQLSSVHYFSFFTLVDRFQTRKTFSTIAIAARSNVLNGALGNLDSKRAFLKAKFFQIAWSAKISTSNSFELSVCPNEVRILMHYFWCWCRTLLIIDTKAVSLTVSSNMGFNSGWRPFSNFLRTRYCTAKQCAQ